MQKYLMAVVLVMSFVAPVMAAEVFYIIFGSPAAYTYPPATSYAPPPGDDYVDAPPSEGDYNDEGNYGNGQPQEGDYAGAPPPEGY
jgi:hypothetical protein